MTTPNLVAKWSRWDPQLQSVLRIVAAFVFILAGTMKLFVWLYFSAAGPGPWSLDARRS